jgi:hypothetical protein
MKTKKQEILIRAKRLVKHREMMMRKFGAKPKYSTITKIITRLDFYSSRDIKTISRLILTMQEDIRSILAGETSKFYKSDQKKAAELFEMCNNNLTN